LEVDAGREHVALAGQNHGVWFVAAFETIEGVVKVGKEAIVLDVHLVGVHDDDCTVIDEVDLPSHDVSSPTSQAASCLARRSG